MMTTFIKNYDGITVPSLLTNTSGAAHCSSLCMGLKLLSFILFHFLHQHEYLIIQCP